MGNSEVGHLTIGSGRILFQDLMRVNQAIRDGSLLRNEALAGRLRAGTDARRERAPTRAGLARRRALAHRPPARPARARADARDGGPHLDPRLHGRTRRLADLRRRGSRAAAGRPDRDGRRAATTRWTAIAAGTGPKGRSRRSREGGVHLHHLPTLQKKCNGTTTRVSQTSSSSRSSSRGRRGSAHEDAAIFFNFRPDRARQLSQKLVESGIDLTTMTRYSDELDVPFAFGEQEVRNTLAEVLAALRRAAAPRRRDGEVRARHVLLQRRSRDGVAG